MEIKEIMSKDAIAFLLPRHYSGYEDSDAVQVKIDGVTYYTHLENVVLING